MSSINATSLPAFFQTNSKTVLDELADFELGGGESSDTADELLLEEDQLQGLVEKDQLNELTFDEDTFGDLRVTDLPDFFTQSAYRESTGTYNHL